MEGYVTRIAFRRYLGGRDPSDDPCLELGLRYILETLDRHGTTGTFFVLGEAAARRPDLVRDILARGHEVASHAHHHAPLRGAPADRLRSEMRESLQALRAAGAKEVLGFRAPRFSLDFSEESIRALRGAGFRYDSSLFPAWTPYYGSPRAPAYPHRLANGEGSALWELPLVSFLAGSLQLPVKPRYMGARWTSEAIRRLNAQGKPAVILFHPWELVPPPPLLLKDVPRRVRLARDFRIPCAGLLEDLLSKYEFTSAARWLLERTR